VTDQNGDPVHDVDALARCRRPAFSFSPAADRPIWVVVERQLTRLLVSVALGLVATVVVAASCALWSQPGMARSMDDAESAEFELKYPGIAATFGDLASARANGFGYTQYVIVGTSREKEEAVITMIVEAGWPMRCFSGTVWDHEDETGVRRVNCVPAPNSIGPLPVDPRRNRLIPYEFQWLGFGADALLFSLIVRFFPWGLFGWLAPTERGQRVSFTDLHWLQVRFLASIVIGIVLVIGSTVGYAFSPRTCLSSATMSVGMTELPSGAYLMARRYKGTGIVLNALYVLDAPENDRDGVWKDRKVPPAETVPDAWCASLIGEFDETTQPGQGQFALGYGWPRPAMWLVHDWKGSGLGAADARFFHGRYALWLGASEPQVGYPRALPIRPVVSGLVSNTASYVGAVMATFLSAGLVRRWIRRHHSQCPTCGHFLPETDGICPDCGEGRRSRRTSEGSAGGYGGISGPGQYIPGLGIPLGAREPPDGDEDQEKPQNRRGAA
jgi:hypothetical protein